MKIGHEALARQVEIWSKDDPYQAAMIATARLMLERPPESLFHDELGEYFAPQYLTDVAAAARVAGLDYLCDAQPHLNAEAFFPSERYAAARERAGSDWVRFEQLADFTNMHSFRSSVFRRGGGADRRIAPERLRGLWGRGRFEPAEPAADAPGAVAFKVGEAGTVTTNNPKLGELLAVIGASFPASVALDGAADDLELAASILRLFVQRCIVLSAAPSPVAAAPGERPCVSPLARLQASRGESLLTTLNQTCVFIEDDAFRDFVPLVDGVRTRAELAAALTSRVGQDVEDARLADMLAIMAKLALLTA
jgi:hypothetical protein